MQLTVKTLKGEKFAVNAEPSNTVAEVKAIIETEKSELPAANMKLIHSGKVLKDADSIESCNIKPNAFLVVMITKAKKTAAAPAAAAATTPAPATPAAASSSTPAAPTKSTEASSTTAAASETTATPAPTATTTSTPSATTPAPTSTTTTSSSDTAATTPAAAATDEFPAEMVANLTAMGFPDAEVRACLRASQGNPDVAVEFLMNGIPPGIQALQAGGAGGASTPATAPSTTASGGEALSALRSHPQINQLRQLVQSNPQSLQAVLTQIGQQQPSLLQEINNNQELFLQIMNEPVTSPSTSTTPATSTSAASTTSSSSSSTTTNAPSSSSSAAAGGFGAAESGQAQALAQMIQGMSPEQMNSMASMYGITPEQLQMTAQMIGQLPPEQLQQYMNMALGGAGGAGGVDLSGLMGAMGGGAGGAGGAGGPQVLELNAEEMAAVNRLADMGFDRSEAAQAYLACDKNEALAANLLMDGGFGFQDDVGGGAPGSGGADGSGGSGGDNMYD